VFLRRGALVGLLKLLSNVAGVIVEFPIVLDSRWVIDEPTYQVVFWRKHNDPEPPLRPLWGSEPHRLREVADLNEVLVWAETHANGRLVAIYAEVDRGPDQGLVLLRGRDPTWDG
jgi:hypothetical protein